MSPPPAVPWFVLFVVTLDLGMVLSGRFGVPAATLSGAVLLAVACRLSRSVPGGTPARVRAENVEVGEDGGALSRAALPATAGRLLSALMLVELLSNVTFLHFQHARLTPVQLGILGAGSAFFLLQIARPLSPRALVLGAVLLGICLRVASYGPVAIDPVKWGDQLPLVRGAVQAALHGQTPYRIHHFPGWDLPLPYLPVTWLLYLPAYALGVDIRLTNLLCELAVGAILFALSLRAPRRRLSTWVPLLWACTFLGAQQVHWSLCCEMPVFFLFEAAILVLTLDERPRAAAVVLGLGLAGSPLTNLLAPFVALYWLRRYGWLRTLRLLVLAGLLVAVLLTPFLWADARTFYFGVFELHNNNNLAPLDGWRFARRWAYQIGFAGLFWQLGWQDVLKPIQAVLMTGLLVRYVRRGATAAALLPSVSLALVVFVCLNPIIWSYLYWPGALAALLAMAYVPRTPVSARHPRAIRG